MIMYSRFKSYLRQFLSPTHQTIFDRTDIKKNFAYSIIKNFGNLNKDKVFYIIKRTPGTGLFSNVVFVLNHLAIAKKFNFIPMVDMKNYITIYNEKKKIKNIENAWEYYFENTSNYTLEEVYKSNKVIITNDQFHHHFKYDMEDPYFKDLISKKILVKKNIKKITEKIKNKHFSGKLLAVHFRGTSYKASAGHPLPATKKQMLNLVKKIYGIF